MRLFAAVIAVIALLIVGLIAGVETLVNDGLRASCDHFQVVTGLPTRWEQRGNVLSEGTCWWERAPGIWIRGLPR